MSDKPKESGEAAPPKKSKMKLIIIILVVVIAAFGAGGFFAFKKFGKTVKANDEEAQASTKKKEKEEVTSVLKLDSFVVNLSDPGGMRFFRVELSIGLHGEMINAEGKKDKNGDPVLVTQVRDAIIQMLSSKHSEELLTPDGKKKLREEILETVSPFFKNIQVTGIFFTDYMVQ